MPFRAQNPRPADDQAEALNDRLRPLGMLAVHVGDAEDQRGKASGEPPRFTLLVRRLTIAEAERLAGAAGAMLGRG
jgi:hypothetical protein